MARPRKSLTKKEWDSVNYMCMIHCTGEEIAGVMQMDYDTLNRNCKEKFGIPISEYIKQHCQNGKMSLRRAQWKAAEKGNASMLIWLGKQWLGQRDEVVADFSEGVYKNIKSIAELINNPLPDISIENLAESAASLDLEDDSSDE